MSASTLARSTTVSDDPVEAAELLAVRRAAFHAYEHAGNIFSEDVGVPRSQLPEMFARIEAISAKYDVDIPTCAHAGDGNLHINVLKPDGMENADFVTQRSEEAHV